MHPHNRDYGQNEVLASFAGLADRTWPPRVPGHLQHRWAATSCLGAGPLSMPQFVWNRRAARDLAGRGQRDVVVIGAPWLYLLERRDLALRCSEPLDRAGTLIFPGHHPHDVDGATATAELASATLRGPLTVALAAPPRPVLDAYHAADVSVVPLGRIRRGMGEDGPCYLERLAELFLLHAHVASDRPHPALVLGAATGAVPVLVDRARAPLALPWMADHDKVAELATGLLVPTEASDAARSLLGREFLLGPDDIAALLEWSPNE
ncbi:MAG TPA: hypothetical protein VES95_03430 [Dermatophilaceae bacterium]|nr:hypothetical protein [Dermatophilaceae bacterium]